MLFLIYLTELLIANVLLPMIHIYMIVRVLNDLSRENYLTKFAELIETGVSWSLKALLAVVAGFNVVQGMISPAIDSVKRSILARGAEAIPGVGDALGGMAEVAAGTAGTGQKRDRYGRSPALCGALSGAACPDGLYHVSL